MRDTASHNGAAARTGRPTRPAHMCATFTSARTPLHVHCNAPNSHMGKKAHNAHNNSGGNSDSGMCVCNAA